MNPTPPTGTTKSGPDSLGLCGSSGFWKPLYLGREHGPVPGCYDCILKQQTWEGPFTPCCTHMLAPVCTHRQTCTRTHSAREPTAVPFPVAPCTLCLTASRPEAGTRLGDRQPRPDHSGSGEAQIPEKHHDEWKSRVSKGLSNREFPLALVTIL